MTPADANLYEVGLDKNAANYVPLTPIGFLLRSAAVYTDRLARSPMASGDTADAPISPGSRSPGTGHYARRR